MGEVFFGGLALLAALPASARTASTCSFSGRSTTACRADSICIRLRAIELEMVYIGLKSIPLLCRYYAVISRGFSERITIPSSRILPATRTLSLYQIACQAYIHSMLPSTIASIPALIDSGSLAQLARRNWTSESDRSSAVIEIAKNAPDFAPPSSKTPKNKGFFAVVRLPVGWVRFAKVGHKVGQSPLDTELLLTAL